MKHFKIMRSVTLLLLPLLLVIQSCLQKKASGEEKETSTIEYYSMDDFRSVPKFDTHVHLNTDEDAFIKRAKEDNIRFLNIVNDRPFGITMEDQQKVALKQLKAFPNQMAYATTFSVKDFSDDNWQEKTINYLKNSIENGAIAVKIWKNIGMDLRDKDGNFVMVDHPRLDPILDFLVENSITLVGHLGEPKDCWLPLEEMKIKGNKGYYSSHPEYHMYLHPEYPSYEDQIRARDNMLEKHPDLKFIGAHLGSLEWSLDELAKRLDKYPNMAVDMARMSNLQLHAMNDWQKTRDFFIKYQDRLVYATDRAVNPTENPENLMNSFTNGRMRDWKFFTTDEEMESSGFEGTFKGLKLPRNVVDKIYRKNAEKWLISLDKNLIVNDKNEKV
jgi:predicted TIM-barrel fold metal-dependent hydrolase